MVSNKSNKILLSDVADGNSMSVDKKLSMINNPIFEQCSNSQDNDESLVGTGIFFSITQIVN